jgi:hypothetical protein
MKEDVVLTNSRDMKWKVVVSLLFSTSTLRLFQGVGHVYMLL